MRRYCINSIENMRDIGGYLVENKKLSYGKIIRSNLPNRMTKSELDNLEKMKIETVIDLRSEEEIQKEKSVFENNKCFKLLHYKMEEGRDVPNSCEDVPISYMKMLESKEVIYKIFKVLAEEEKGVLYFCNAGKDRTGVVTALILMTLGVDKKDIITDYTLSNIYLKDKLEEFEKNSPNRKIKEIITPKIDYMQQFLNYFEEKYKTIDSYLYEIGITEKEINQIKNKYLE